MGEWPKRYHPARPDDDGDGLAVDTSVVVEGYQLQPGTWDACALWCGAWRVLDATGNQALAVRSSLLPDDVALLGDFLMATADGYRVDRADGHYQRWQSVEEGGE